MPIALPNLYCMPSDVYDFLSSAGVDLRLDDANQATGQRIQATANAIAGATTVAVTPLQYPLLNGSTLQFEGSGMPAQSPAVLSAFAKVGATSLTVSALAAQVNSLSTARDSGVNLIGAQRLVKSCQYATSQVKLYCCKRYDDDQLVQAWSCNRWATTLAARWMCRRRMQQAPKGIEADAADCLDEMRQVMSGAMSIEDIGTRTTSWPYISNFEIDVRYNLGRVRVIPLLSEGTPTNYGQLIDWNSIFLTGYW